jgi:hypothetical protein
MAKTVEPRPEHSPVAILTELAVEGTSTFIEAQRIFLNLIQQENDLLMDGVKERIGVSAPMVAMTDLARRSIDTLIDMQHGLLTTTSKQTLHWLESVQAGKGYESKHVVELAREAMENFVHAHQKFLDVLTQETKKATSGKAEHTPVQKKELSKLAREAAALFIDAQKKVLDVLGQQMNVNLNAATQAVETLSPARLVPMATIPAKAVKTLFDGEKALFQSVIQSQKKSKAGERGNHSRKHNVRRKTA